MFFKKSFDWVISRDFVKSDMIVMLDHMCRVHCKPRAAQSCLITVTTTMFQLLVLSLCTD